MGSISDFNLRHRRCPAGEVIWLVLVGGRSCPRFLLARRCCSINNVLRSCQQYSRCFPRVTGWPSKYSVGVVSWGWMLFHWCLTRRLLSSCNQCLCKRSVPTSFSHLAHEQSMIVAVRPSARITTRQCVMSCMGAQLTTS